MIERPVRIAVVLCVAAIAIDAVYARIGLYADGSFFLLEMLQNPRFVTYDPARIHSIYLTQFPLLLAMKAGVSDLGALIRLHTLGLQFPLLLWIAALLLHLRSSLFWFFVSGFSVTVLTSGFFAIGEYNCAAALAALCAAVLLRPQANHWCCGLLLAAAIGFLRAYESAAFLAPLLIGMAALRLAVVRGDAPWVKASWVIALGLFAAASWIAWASILDPVRPRMLAGATTFQPLLRSGQVIYIALVSALLPLSFLLARRRAVAAGALAAVTLSIIFFCMPRWWIVPHAHYGFRALSAVMLFVALSCAALTAYASRLAIPGLDRTVKDRMAPLAAACFVTLALVFVSYLSGFRAWADQFETEVETGRGIIPIERTGLAGSRFAWEWSNPSLSVVLRGDGEGAIIANRLAYKEWEPFPPDQPPALPLVHKHGRIYQWPHHECRDARGKPWQSVWLRRAAPFPAIPLGAGAGFMRSRRAPTAVRSGATATA